MHDDIEPALIESILEYFRLLWKGWAAAVTGGALAVFGAVWTIFSKDSRPVAIIVACVTVYFLIVRFTLWRTERRRALRAEARPFSREIANDVAAVMRQLKAADEKEGTRYMFLMYQMAKGITLTEDTTQDSELLALESVTGGWVTGGTIVPTFLPAVQAYFEATPMPPKSSPG